MTTSPYGWFDDEQHRNIVTKVMKFLHTTDDHFVVGLQILSEFVSKMVANCVPPGNCRIVSRRVALWIFQVALNSVKQLQMHNFGGATPQ